MIESNKYLMKCNQDFWDSLVDEHYSSEFYGVDKFLNGQNSLDEIELKVIGEIAGKNILHVQCHFGLSTLSLAREGGSVSGADFPINRYKQPISYVIYQGLMLNFISPTYMNYLKKYRISLTLCSHLMASFAGSRTCVNGQSK